MLADDALREARHDHPLAGVLSIIRRLLVEPAADAGLIVALGNAADAWARLEPLVERAGDDPLRPIALSMLGRILWQSHRLRSR